MKIVAENRKAKYEYEIVEEFEAGVQLMGYEVKAVKNGLINIIGTYAIIRGGEVFWVGANIQPYQPKNTPDDYDTQRTRKLLLKKREIKSLIGKIKEKGLTLVPKNVYIKAGKIKVALVLARHKKKQDKREVIQERETRREIARELKKLFDK